MRTLLFIVLLYSLHLNAQTEFVTTWKTDNPGPSDDYTITIPLASDSEYDFTIDWGDGYIQAFSGLGSVLNVTHTYAVVGSYSVSIEGVFPRIYFNYSGDKEKLLSVNQWGNNVWSSFRRAFTDCYNLHILASDVPNLSNVTDLSSMFRGASVMNEELNDWDVSNINNMSGLFSLATAFNQPLNSWDVSNVSDMSSMFSSASAFNQPLDLWNTENVTNMKSMFRNSEAFDQPIGNWNTFNVVEMDNMFNGALVFDQPIGNWNTSQVISVEGMFIDAVKFNQSIENWNMVNVQDVMMMFSHATLFNQPINDWQLNGIINYSDMFGSAESFNQPLDNWNTYSTEILWSMFRGATSFNQPLDSWDVSNVENMQRMFEGATSFNQSLGNWDLSSCFNFSQMLDNCGMSPCNYDLTLQGWDNSTTNNNQTLGAQGMQYTAEGAIARQSMIDNRGWIILGDALVELTDLLVEANINGPEISITLSGGTGSYLYSWTGPNGFASNESSIVAPQNGLYTVTVTDGCETWSDTFEVLTVQILESEKTNIQIFPNPSNGQVQIVAPSTQQLTLYDHSGRMVLKTNINSGYQKLDLSSLMPGVYSGSLISLSGEFLQTVRITLVR